MPLTISQQGFLCWECFFLYGGSVDENSSTVYRVQFTVNSISYPPNVGLY